MIPTVEHPYGTTLATGGNIEDSAKRKERMMSSVIPTMLGEMHPADR
jgi:hypothetical protein